MHKTFKVRTSPFQIEAVDPSKVELTFSALGAAQAESVEPKVGWEPYTSSYRPWSRGARGQIVVKHDNASKDGAPSHVMQSE